MFEAIWEKIPFSESILTFHRQRFQSKSQVFIRRANIFRLHFNPLSEPSTLPKREIFDFNRSPRLPRKKSPNQIIKIREFFFAPASGGGMARDIGRKFPSRESIQSVIIMLLERIKRDLHAKCTHIFGSGRSPDAGGWILSVQALIT